MRQRQQQVGSHMACALFVNLVEWKVWKRHSRDCWTKITIIYNFTNVYQTKDIHPWSDSLKSVQVWVIEKSNSCALGHCSCKSTAENFNCYLTDVVAVKIIFDKNSYHRSLKFVVLLPSVRAGCVELIAGQFQSQGHDFGSAQNIQLLHGFFASKELLALAGVDSLVLVGQK